MIRVLFEVAQEYYWTGFEPVYRAMAADSRYDLRVRVGPNQKRILGLFLVSRRGAVERWFREQGVAVTRDTAGFDAVVCGSVLKHPGRYENALLCNVDHGPGLKTLRYREFLKQPDTRYVIFAEGRYRLERFRSYRLDRCLDLVDVGLPKLDPFFDGTFDRDRILAGLNLDPARPTVLYAPSYKPTSIFDLAPAVADLARRYNVVVKLHPYSWSGKYASHKQHRVFEDLEGASPHFRLIPREEHNMMPYMFAADTLVSEGSSVINEFLALGRCGVIYDLEEASHSDGEPLLADSAREWLKDSFVHIQNADQLEQAVETALNPSPPRRKHLERDQDYVFSYTDGCSAERVKRHIEGLLGSRREA